MITRKFQKKERLKQKRIPKPLILIMSEENAITESQAFQSFQAQYADSNIRILTPGHHTNPEEIKEILLQYWKQHNLDETKGDLAFIVLASDKTNGRLFRKLAGEY